MVCLGVHFGAHLGALGATIWSIWDRFEATLSKVVAKQAVEGFTQAVWGHFEPMRWHLEAVLGPFWTDLVASRGRLGAI